MPVQVYQFPIKLTIERALQGAQRPNLGGTEAPCHQLQAIIIDNMCQVFMQ